MRIPLPAEKTFDDFLKELEGQVKVIVHYEEEHHAQALTARAYYDRALGPLEHRFTWVPDRDCYVIGIEGLILGKRQEIPVKNIPTFFWAGDTLNLDIEFDDR